MKNKHKIVCFYLKILACMYDAPQQIKAGTLYSLAMRLIM